MIRIRPRAPSTESNPSEKKTPKAKNPIQVDPFFDGMNAFCDDTKALHDALDDIEKEMNTVQKDSFHWFTALPEDGVHSLDYVEKNEQLEQLKKEFNLVMLSFAKDTVGKFKHGNIDGHLKQELKQLVLEVTGLIRKTQQFNDLSLLNAQIEFFSVLRQRIEQILDSSRIEAGGPQERPKVVAPSAPPWLGTLPYSVEPFVPPLYPEPFAPPLYPEPSAPPLYPEPSAPPLYPEPLPQQIQSAATTDKMPTAKSKQVILEELNFNSDCTLSQLESFIQIIDSVQYLVNKKTLTAQNLNSANNESVVVLLEKLNKIADALQMQKQKENSGDKIKQFLSDLVQAATHKDAMSARLNRKTSTISMMIEKAKTRMDEISKGIRNIPDYKNSYQNSLGQWIEQGTLLNKDKHTGVFQDSAPRGKEVFEYANGDRYEGYSENGKYHGEGVLHFSNGGEYKGQFQNGKYHGNGTLISRNGDRYDGQFKDGEYHGEGTFRYANGKVYRVEFRNGRILRSQVSETETKTEAQKDNGVKPFITPKTRHEMVMTKARFPSDDRLALNLKCKEDDVVKLLNFIKFVQNKVNKKEITIGNFENNATYLLQKLEDIGNSLSFCSDASDAEQKKRDFLLDLVICATHENSYQAKLDRNTAAIDKVIARIKSQFAMSSFFSPYFGHINKKDGKSYFGVFKYRDTIYEGDWKDGKHHGTGKLTYSNGDVYEGNFENGNVHGTGKYTCSNGSVYAGNWKDGMRHGTGKLTYFDRAVYEGDWKNGMRHGTGKLTYRNGNVYEGDWKDGMHHGKGKLTYSNRDVYEGDCKDGMRHGTGKLTYRNGDVYEGNFENGNVHGTGKYTCSNGTVYEGEWKDGMRHGTGKGKQIYSNGDVYEGDWKDGVRHGKGKLTYSNGDVYEGDCKDGMHHGKGKQIYSNGDVYEGDWKNGVRHGAGKLTSNGNVYEGDWKNGVRHGTGKQTYCNGYVYEGGWKDGLYHGAGKQTYRNGDVYEGGWKNGVRHGAGKLTPNGNVYKRKSICSAHLDINV